MDSLKKLICPKAFFTLVAFLAFGVFCKIHYSDGDDAFFDQYAHTMNFVDYIKWRYVTWTGRLGGEAVVFGTFSIGIWFWRFVNAAMFTLLPACLSVVLKGNATPKGIWSLRLPLMLACGYILMDIMTFGHAAIWVNGSIFYTWAVVAILITLLPFFKFLKTGTFSSKHLIYGIPLGFFAVTSIEQIGFAGITILACGIAYSFYKKFKVPVSIWAMLATFIAAFAILYFAPGNASRIQAETENWYSQFASLTFGEHFFITYQWLISSFANEGKAFFALIWLAAIFADKRNVKFSIPAGMFIAVALLPFAKINLLSDIGLSYIDPGVVPEVYPSSSAMTCSNWIALLWWSIATVFTGVMLWNMGRAKLLGLFLLAIATEALMYFSPTIYASGERVFYVADWILLSIAIFIWNTIKNEKQKNAYAIVVVCIGILNALSQVPIILSKLG